METKNLTSGMDSLKHNQPQLSVVLFNQKNMLDFSMQPLSPPPPVMRAGVKSLTMPCHKVFRLRRNYNFKILHPFASFLPHSDSLQAEIFFLSFQLKAGKHVFWGEKCSSIYLVKKETHGNGKKGFSIFELILKRF